MEASREVVDEVAWRLVVERTFRKADFREDHAGQVWSRGPKIGAGANDPNRRQSRSPAARPRAISCEPKARKSRT